MSGQKDKAEKTAPSDTKLASPPPPSATEQTAPSTNAERPAEVNVGSVADPGALNKREPDAAQEDLARERLAAQQVQPKPTDESVFFGGAFDGHGKPAAKTQKELLREQMAAKQAAEQPPKRRGKRVTFGELEQAAKDGKSISVASLIHPPISNHAAPGVGLVTRTPRSVNLAGLLPDAFAALARDESLDVVIED